jgi:hypothetical protein
MQIIVRRTHIERIFHMDGFVKKEIITEITRTISPVMVVVAIVCRICPLSWNRIPETQVSDGVSVVKGYSGQFLQGVCLGFVQIQVLGQSEGV